MKIIMVIICHHYTEKAHICKLLWWRILFFLCPSKESWKHGFIKCSNL